MLLAGNEAELKPADSSNPQGCKQRDIRNCSTTKTPSQMWTKPQVLLDTGAIMFQQATIPETYKWSFIAHSFPHPLLCVPCGKCGITGFSHSGQQHF